MSGSKPWFRATSQ